MRLSYAAFLAIIPALGLAIAAGAAERTPLRLSEPVAVTATHEVFGAPLADDADGISLRELLAAADAHAGEPVRVTTEIAQVCQKKGCFFIAREGEAVARVTFADYGFFIPTDAGGKTVTLVGTLTRESISAAQAAHFAADLGDPEAAAEPFAYAIVATSVMIPRG